MMVPRVKTYLTQDQVDGVSVFKQLNDFYILLQIPDALTEDELEMYCATLEQAVAASSFTTATEFDGAVSDAFRISNLPLGFSISCLYLKEFTIFLKTYGQGSVVLKREGRQISLVKSGAFASGQIKVGDGIALCFGDQDPFENVENAVHLEFMPEGLNETKEESVPEAVLATPEQRERVKDFERKPLKRQSDALILVRAWFVGRKKGRLLAVVLAGLLIFAIFINSYNSKTAKEDRLNLENATSTITQKLEQAEDVFELNSGRSVALLAETKKDLKALEKKLHSSHKNEIVQLTEKISATEKKILQKNIKSAVEFLDLGLEEKGAQGTAMWRYEDKVIIINQKGAVYILSLEKKSLEARSSPSIVGASLGGLDESTVYVYKKGIGVIKIESDTAKPKTAIKQDKEWGAITDLQVFNKNLYLLDSSKGQVYKYVPTEDGFATKSAYFKSGAYAQNAVSFAIDQSVYVAQKKLITKYTSGLQDGFSPTYPDSGPSITRVMTGGDVDDLYIWDKSNGRVVILSKNGDYRKTIESSILSKASSVEVFADAAYALQGSKIYKVSLK